MISNYGQLRPKHLVNSPHYVLLTRRGPATLKLHPQPLIDPLFQHIRQCPTCIKVNKLINFEARRYIKNSNNATDDLDDYFLLWGVPTNIKNRQTLVRVRYNHAVWSDRCAFMSECYSGVHPMKERHNIWAKADLCKSCMAFLPNSLLPMKFPHE